MIGLGIVVRMSSARPFTCPDSFQGWLLVDGCGEERGGEAGDTVCSVFVPVFTCLADLQGWLCDCM